MSDYKIGLLILATSKNRDNWVSIKDTYLFNLTLKTFLLTMNKEYEYIFYIGIDKNDRIFDNPIQQEEILRLWNEEVEREATNKEIEKRIRLAIIQRQNPSDQIETLSPSTHI